MITALCRAFSTSTASAPASWSSRRSARGTRTSPSPSRAATRSSSCAARRAAAAPQRPRRAARGARPAGRRRPRRVPRVLAACPDESVIGAPFYVMEHVDGHVVTSEVPAELDTVEDRRRMGEELVDALVEVHAVDWQAVGLEGYGKPTGYTSARSAASPGCGAQQDPRDPAGREGRRLAGGQPPGLAAGDDRPRRLPAGNVMLAPRRPRAADRDLRLGDVDDRRPARRPRLPVHAVGLARRPVAGDVSSSRASRVRRASPCARSSSPATRSARAAR